MSPLQLILQLVAVVGIAGVFFYLAMYLEKPSLFLISGLMAVHFVPLVFAVQGLWRSGSS